ncbi:MAG: hypothetical protein GXN92_02250 [Candidatus Micrarchaeota archaeon]|nr:hypothetical protein [Candidatus Micrarchaeota archaeon]
MLWLLLVSLVFAPTGLNVDIEHEINFYIQGNEVWLNFTSYANIPQIKTSPGEGIEEGTTFYEITASEGAKLTLFDQSGNILCEAEANTPDDQARYWGTCKVPLDPNQTYILYYKIEHPEYVEPIVGYTRVRVNELNGQLFLSTSITPIGVDVGKIVLDHLNKADPELLFLLILLMVLIGSTLYYRGEALASGIFDLLFPRLPRPRADLEWSGGMTPTGPLFGKIKQMKMIQKLFTTTGTAYALINNTKNHPLFKKIVPNEGNIPEAMALLTLAILDKLQKNPPSDQILSQYKKLLGELAQKLQQLPKEKNLSVVQQKAAEIEELLNRIVSIHPETKKTSTRDEVYQPTIVTISGEAERLRKMVRLYVGMRVYDEGYAGMIQKFYPAEQFASWGKEIPEKLMSQIRTRRITAELLSRRLGKFGYYLGYGIDKGIGVMAYPVGMAMKPMGMIMFWMGKTTRQFGVMLHELILPWKMMAQQHTDPGISRVKAEKAYEKRNEYIKLSREWAIEDGLYNYGSRLVKKAEEKKQEGKKLTAIMYKAAGRTMQGLGLFPITRWAAGFVVGMGWYGLRAQLEDMRWFFYSVPYSKEIKPTAIQRITYDTVHKAQEDAIKLLYLDRVKKLTEELKIEFDLHKMLYSYYRATPTGRMADRLRAEVKRLLRQIDSNPNIQPLVSELDQLVKIYSYGDPLEKQKALQEFLARTSIKEGTYNELALLLIKELDNFFNTKIETKNGEVRAEELFRSPQLFEKTNITLIEALLGLDKRVREESELRIGRKWGIFDKDYQAPSADDPYLNLARNLKEEEAFWASAAAFGARLGGFKEGFGAAMAISVQNLQPVLAEVWTAARLLGYDFSTLLKDPEIDERIKLKSIEETAEHLGLKEIFHLTEEEIKQRYKGETLEAALLLKEAWEKLQQGETPSFSEEYIPRPIENIWKGLVEDPRYLEMHAILYYTDRPSPDVEIPVEDLRRRALSDLFDLRETFIKGLEAISPALTEEDIKTMFSDENKFQEVLSRDPRLSTIFDVSYDPVAQEGRGSSRVRMKVVSYDELVRVVKDDGPLEFLKRKEYLKAQGEVPPDAKDTKQWLFEHLKNDVSATELRIGDLPLPLMVKKGDLIGAESTAVGQSYLTYKKGVHQQNPAFTLPLHGNQMLEAQSNAADPMGSAAPQIPLEASHVANLFVAGQKLLEDHALPVPVESITIEDIEKLFYGKKIYSAKLQDGKLEIKEDPKGDIGGHGGELYNIPGLHDHAMIITRNDEAFELPNLYNERFQKRLKKISRRRFSVLTDEDYLTEVSDRLSFADIVVNMEKVRWDPIKRTYVPVWERDVNFPLEVYRKLITRSLPLVDEHLQKEGPVHAIFDTLYLYGSAAPMERLLKAFVSLPALKYKGVPKELHSTLNSIYRSSPRRLQSLIVDKEFQKNLTTLLTHLRSQNDIYSKLILEYVMWKLSGEEHFGVYYAQRRNQLQSLLNLYKLSQKKPELKPMLEKKLQEMGYSVEMLEKMESGYYLGVMDRVGEDRKDFFRRSGLRDENEWLGFLGAMIAHADNKPKLFRHVRRAYIVDGVENIRAKVGKAPVKQTIGQKLKQKASAIFYRDIALWNNKILVDNLFLNYAMKYEMADHGSSLAQLNYPAAASYMETYISHLILVHQKLLIEKENILEELKKKRRELRKHARTLQQEITQLKQKLRQKYGCRRCNWKKLAQQHDDEELQHLLKLEEELNSIRKVLRCGFLCRDIPSLPQFKDYEKLLRRLQEIYQEEVKLLQSIQTIYEVEKATSFGFVASAWVATTRSSDKIYASLAGFSRGAQIAADFHAGSGLYHPWYIVMAAQAARTYSAVAGIGAHNLKLYLPRGYFWHTLPFHEVSLGDFWEGRLAKHLTKEERELILKPDSELTPEQKEHKEKLLKSLQTHYFIQMNYMKEGMLNLLVGATWRTIVQPFLLASITERAIFRYGIGSHGRLADVRQFYQAYMKSMSYTSSLDVTYLMSSEELNQLLSSMPSFLAYSLQSQIPYMVLRERYYSAKASNIEYGIGYPLALQHLGSLSPFHPRTLIDNQQYLSFALHTLGAPFGLPLGMVVDFFEVLNPNLPLMWRHGYHGRTFLESVRGNPILGRVNEGMGVSDWEERIGYYLIPASKTTWYSPVTAKRSDLPGYGMIDLNLGHLRVENWLTRMYLGRHTAVYDTNRLGVSWSARWESYREEAKWYLPEYNIYYAFLNPLMAFDYFTHADSRSSDTAGVRLAKSVASAALMGGKAMLGAASLFVPYVGPVGGLLWATSVSQVANKSPWRKNVPTDRCPVCGSPKRRGMRCPRCGAP